MRSRKIDLQITSVFQYLKVLNGFLELTDTDRLILATLIEVHLERPNDPAITSTQKKEAARRLGRKNFNSLNNYIKKFKDMKIIEKQVEGYKFSAAVLPQDTLTFNFKWLETQKK